MNDEELMIAALDSARGLMGRATEMRAHARDRRAAAVVTAYNAGLPIKTIAEHAGVTPRLVHYIVKNTIEETGE